MSEQIFFAVEADELVIDQVGDELLIYDRRSDVAHALSETAAVVWRRCAAGASLGHLAAAVEPLLAGGDSEALALAALAELYEKGLLLAPVPTDGISRRQVIRRMAGVGVAALAAPLVVSAAVPNSAAAVASPLGGCVPVGGSCNHAGTANAGNNCCTSTGAGQQLYCSSTSLCTQCLKSGQVPSGGCTSSNTYQCCSGACSTQQNHTTECA
jgi:hypothetical protein